MVGALVAAALAGGFLVLRVAAKVTAGPAHTVTQAAQQAIRHWLTFKWAGPMVPPADRHRAAVAEPTVQDDAKEGR